MTKVGAWLEGVHDELVLVGLEGVHDELVLVGQRRHRVSAEIQAVAAAVPAVNAGEQTWKSAGADPPHRKVQASGFPIWTAYQTRTPSPGSRPVRRGPDSAIVPQHDHHPSF